MLQTPAEATLVAEIAKFLQARSAKEPARLLNVGAGASLSIENQLAARKLTFICDRLDVNESETGPRPYAEKSWRASIEHCPQVPSAYYDLAFANYVLEHVRDLAASAREISRILAPGGLFILTTPNPAAPEFRLARYTPLWLHQLIRGQENEAFTTFYAYKDITVLEQVFGQAGFSVSRDEYYSFTLGYLHKWPLVNLLARGYDYLIKMSGQKNLMGNAVIVFKKIS